MYTEPERGVTVLLAIDEDGSLLLSVRGAADIDAEPRGITGIDHEVKLQAVARDSFEEFLVSLGDVERRHLPGVVAEPGAFVVVGMAGFFAGVSNTPISTIIFVSEMTNSYHLLLPSLLVCSVAYTASRRWTIFNRQVQSKVDSPAHAGEVMMDVLQTIKLQELGNKRW